MTDILDQPNRQEALDPQGSYIVQAPAGSGKTELLTQRYLRLLGQGVRYPEEIMAITFTRKAASEMRERIMGALNMAAFEPEPEAPHKKLTWQLGQAALKQDNLHEWGILSNPNRIRTLTIDALCASLTRQMPVISRFGGLPHMLDNAKPHYQSAARALLNGLETQEEWSSAIRQLLLHLNNDLARVESLLADILSHRDQWLPYLIQARQANGLRAQLEGHLSQLVSEHLRILQNAFPEHLRDAILDCVRFAARNLHQQHQQSPIIACLELKEWPSSDIRDLSLWLGIVDLLLTGTGEWRKTVDKRTGFPAASAGQDKAEQAHFKAMKQSVIALIGLCQEQNVSLELLRQLRLLPPDRYTDAQWAMVEALLVLLPLAVAHLRLEFEKQGAVDFIEVSQAALTALGDAESPSELALRLDYSIQHILVDEVQDISVTQGRLLESLTAGWTHNDGRTCFLVGDPMQSIYRFRQAEVGLFIQMQKNKRLGTIPIKPLRLQCNFRSNETIVNWVNRVFYECFPKHDDPAMGAVSYAPSTAVQLQGSSRGVTVHALAAQETEEEALHVVSLIKQAKAANPNATIAVLVRARSHLGELFRLLRRANIEYQAIDIDSLYWRPLIQDLLSLCKAMNHLGDRLAWLSVLRAPWCGLTLADLHLVANYDLNQTLWHSIKQLCTHEDNRLSAEGRQSLNRLYCVLESHLAQRYRLSVRDALEKTWIALGGPASLQEAYELEHAERFFYQLETFSKGQAGLDVEAFEESLQGLFAEPQLCDENPVQIMTIHKSKGLEFDVVIMPGLDRRPSHDTPKLLLWAEQSNRSAGSRLLIGPIKSTEDERDPIYHYLMMEDRKKQAYEAIRLLYVGCTRAKHQLHLVGRIATNEEGHYSLPSNNTFLGTIWPCIEKDVQWSDAKHGSDTVPTNKARNYRLPASWQNAVLDACSLARQSAYKPNPSVDFARDTAEQYQLGLTAKLGTFIHRQLNTLTHIGTTEWLQQVPEKRHSAWRKALRRDKLPVALCESVIAMTEEAIQKTLADGYGRWLLSEHEDAQSEFPLTSKSGSEIEHHIIDRTFVDEGTRWIVDYKTATRGAESVENFIKHQASQYKSQLETYTKLMSQWDRRPIRKGLYFPLEALWVEL